MSFDQKPIGIGNLTTNLKRVVKSSTEPVSPSAKIPTEGDPEVAQLAVDIRETNDNLIIIAPLAGVDPDDVRIEITEDVVVIEGERENPLPQNSDDDYLVQECFFGPFSRSIVLPEMVNSKKAKASFKKNILVLEIPKLDNVRTRIVKIRKAD
ncbi:Hsp20/alpha crystallin family protein [Candidatus Gracilibacteria bacterium]|nr:Hsp20/alpha crystallin family protein [Candidatus Gracilibacteria bacterium]MCF7856366.1 Hsp20/alpha crystallin family protein [Candidatus Gracilibacteria bacterium]MCF7897111.1 Hsp20/alpha crystallin family protein [Candidatus Gracilibacteria bacterium]